MFFDEPEGVASILENLLRSENKDAALLAFQIAFDLEPAQQGSAAPESGQDENATASEDVQMTEGSQVSNQDVQEADPNEATYAERLDLLILKTELTFSDFCYLQNWQDWLSRATNWAKFSATAGLGVIQGGHLRQCRSLMAPYLPQTEAGGGGNPYSEGGALYALCLIHANHYEGIKQFLRDSVRITNVECCCWRSCGCMGALMVGTAIDKATEILAYAHETQHEKTITQASEMLAYAHETQHEKIVGGLALVIALAVYGREEEADTLIEQMTRILFYVMVAYLPNSYLGGSHPLEFDFTACELETPRIVSLLSESYNPHVRYGAALAVGISCAGALIAMTMVMVQINEASDSRVGAFR
ncbi:26S proteasome regulatory complex, non-ATPase subcomplex, Rpn2/Psmd1 subunit [Actinidia rufa]|uniref:26S proteasome regulatory complex, non-ATPase subcomplex, Rpn2/Psmd1 subunit n=1 Tax=Actinidia rufa TaxID=165716 RepID=A0A7J0FTH7_9ERIC|nr:26S proteasome regulatory complex, non-ATPase subcomplex, Rpn2/Psmd1 subunit [Actinidia rufa]